MPIHRLVTLFMRNYVVILIAIAVGFLPGCARSHTEYWQNRGRDLGDIVTIAVGIGGGAKAMAGPFHCGLFGNMDRLGIRTGKIIGEEDRFDSDTFLLPIGPLAPAIVRNPPFFGIDCTSCRTCEQVVLSHTFPFFSIPEPNYLEGRPRWAGGDGAFYSPRLFHDGEHALQYLTQIEVAGGLGVTVRIGLNPGEMVDLMAGFLGRDLYGDDVKYETQENP